MGGQGSKISQEEEEKLHAVVTPSPSFVQTEVLSQTTPPTSPTSFLPPDVIDRKRKRDLQSMVLDDVQRAFKTRRITVDDPTNDQGIECKAVDSEQDREMVQKFHIRMRQRKAFDTYIIRRQASITRDQYARRHTPHRVRSWNKVQIH
mmetsp:Transcript_645/g.1525  ORF Transcript_645/g.1525 Transcript_645/m.1525 type:complete len:148 (-) Transcript_645:262-705(-)